MIEQQEFSQVVAKVSRLIEKADQALEEEYRRTAELLAGSPEVESDYDSILAVVRRKAFPDAASEFGLVGAFAQLK